MIVVDTNIISYFYLPTIYSDNVNLLFKNDSDWYAPKFWRSEFRNVLAQYLKKGLMNINDAFIFQEEAEQLMDGNEFYVTSRHILTLVNESNCSAYDCEFVALAQLLNVKLVTEDKKIISEFKEIAVNLDSFLS
jgi:predicted nucleic acid-binding protein